MFGPGWKAAVEARLQIAPAPRVRIAGSTRWQSSTRVRTLRSIISLCRSSGCDMNFPARPKPALLIRVPTPSPSASISAIRLAAAPALARSATKMWMAPPSSAATFSSRSRRRATRAKASPRAAHCRANSTPSPADAPVIKVTGRPRASVPQGGFDDLAGLARRLAFGQSVDIVHAFDDLAPDRVLAVEEAAIVEADEELAVGAIRALRTGHR